jgi:hypothetical protein
MRTAATGSQRCDRLCSGRSMRARAPARRWGGEGGSLSLLILLRDLIEAAIGQALTADADQRFAGAHRVVDAKASAVVVAEIEIRPDSGASASQRDADRCLSCRASNSIHSPRGLIIDPRHQRKRKTSGWCGLHQAKADRAPRFSRMSDNRSSVVNLSRGVSDQAPITAARRASRSPGTGQQRRTRRRGVQSRAQAYAINVFGWLAEAARS